MATPVPVVSMMYFFVFSPPKMTGAVRPAFLRHVGEMHVGLAFGLSDFPAKELDAGGLHGEPSAKTERREPEKREMERHQFRNDSKVGRHATLERENNRSWLAGKRRDGEHVSIFHALRRDLTREIEFSSIAGTFFFNSARLAISVCAVAVGAQRKPRNLRSPHLPHAASATYQRGMTALQRGDLVSARAEFEKLVRFAPGSPEGARLPGMGLLAKETSILRAQFRTG